MATLNLDATKLDPLLARDGIRNTWRNILATAVSRAGEEFSYLLSRDFFQGFEFLEYDLIEGLSIGEVGVLYEYSVASTDHASRKDNGQFFTPDDVAKFMVRQATDFPTGTWLDPCSGIGNLSWHLVDAQADKEAFLANNLVLSDKDDLALSIARVLFTLSFQSRIVNFYDVIAGSFVVFDFLSVAHKPEATLFGSSDLALIPKHDFVMVNPPYLGLRKEDARFETSKAKDLYAYFLENIIKTSKGFVAVTPQSFTNAAKFEGLRGLLISNFDSLRIYAFDNIPGNIFYGVKFGSTNSNSANSIRAAITVAKNSGEGHSITPLLRWKTSQRADLLKCVDRFLSKADLTAEYFPKVGKSFSSLFKKTTKYRRLGSLLSSTKTDFVLFVPAAPRYFISALKKEVSRASMKTLYFKSQDDMDFAYILLNSSFMYWWWRVRDGGMTLSLETISSLPMPPFVVDPILLSELEKSEFTNVVYKKNAGALHENVKHSSELVSRLNALVVPSHSDKLMLTHQNSELVQLGL